jgi:chemotaxis family two-component system sensor kinase Cph1
MPEQPPSWLDPKAPAYIQRLESVRHMSPEELDGLPFGVIRLDREGVVVGYNESEARLARRRPADVIGRNFFTEVAPCTNVKEFAERFREGVARGNIHHTFPFVFTFPGRPVSVMITIAYDAPESHAWILVDQSPQR